MSRKSRTKRGSNGAGTPIPGWVTLGVVGIAWGAIALLEHRRPLRERREDQIVRTGRNLAMAALSTTAVTVTQNVILERAWRRAGHRRSGLLRILRLPRPLEVAVGVMLLDYTLWWWHWINHLWSPLWRFHLVHHVDRDLDASTAIRFHFGEMSLSVVFRILQLRVIGPDRFAVSLWQLFLLVSILFHHSAIRLPAGTDRRLALWIVTPRMHEIHHSDFRSETDSNWSSLLSLWDRLHGTWRHDVATEEIRIGVAAWQDPKSVELPRLIEMPFVARRSDWIDETGTPRLHRNGGQREE